MKVITKIGIGAIVCGTVFSAVGITVCALNYKKFNEIYLGEPVSFIKEFDENISELELEVCFMNINIKQGDKLKITAENVPEKFLPDIDISDKKLKITDQDLKSRLKNKDFQLGNVTEEFVGTYTIYIPDKTLDKADINSSFSLMKISELNADKLDIDCSFGEYILKDSECNYADFTSSFGSLEASDLKIKKSGQIANSFGNMDINLSGKNYGFDTATAFGNTQDFNCQSEDVKIEVSNSFGDINFTN